MMLTALALYVVPGLHPLLMPVTGVTSHLLWWTHVVPVSLLAYFYGTRGGVFAIAASVLLLVAGERLFGAGYNQAASWETAWSLAVALALTNLLAAVLAIAAGRAARALREAAYTSSLTGLPNRQYLEAVIAQSHARSTQSHALIFIDLDDFDTINYSLGHDAGDRVLIEFSARLGKCLTNGQILAHWAGDKFAVYLSSDSLADIETLVDQLQMALSLPLDVGGISLRSLTAGFGIALQPCGTNANDLARNADTALSIAKQQGASGQCVFEQSMQDKASYRLAMLNDLSQAIKHGNLLNYYQPIHRSGSGDIVGVETLVRWKHPQKGMVPPDQFIPMAEGAGLIAQLGEIVLRQALRDFQHWRQTGICAADFFLNINISPLQLLETGFTELLASTASAHNIPPNLLVLEITETAMMKSETVSLQILSDLRNLGFRIAIDDFGSGYSSLNYLHKLPVHILKIDKALIDQLEISQQAPLVKPIVEIARALGLQVVAEGVETAGQAQQLADLNVDFLQGYHLSRPAPKEALYLEQVCPTTGQSACAQ